MNQKGYMLCAFFTVGTVRDYDSATASDTKAYADYFGRMLKEGIYLAPSQFEAMFVSAAVTEEEIEKTLKAVRKYFL